MNNKLMTYLKRMGLAAFLFFFLKGLAWLAVFYFGVRIFS
jgi:hypothetical protein|tara:strand:- start:509 stop:628 length:120 start_codon:yes stop_codon:yes gene_type:complete